MRRRRLWLALLVLYAAASLADMAFHLAEPPVSGSHPTVWSRLPVAFAAGLFWPVDLAVRAVLGPG
ncbi:MAG TPA: hypothetical protein VMB84_04965 [Stellaceae bacterium]|nr:hypothetical protein [Stellaceae bacterium]